MNNDPESRHKFRRQREALVVEAIRLTIIVTVDESGQAAAVAGIAQRVPVGPPSCAILPAGHVH